VYLKNISKLKGRLKIVYRFHLMENRCYELKGLIVKLTITIKVEKDIP